MRLKEAVRTKSNQQFIMDGNIFRADYSYKTKYGTIIHCNGIPVILTPLLLERL